MVYFLHSWVSGHIGLWRQKKPCALRRAIKKVGFRNPAGFHPQVDCFVILPFAIVNNLASAPAALGLVQRRPRERTSTSKTKNLGRLFMVSSHPRQLENWESESHVFLKHNKK